MNICWMVGLVAHDDPVVRRSTTASKLLEQFSLVDVSENCGRKWTSGAAAFEGDDV